MPEGKPNRLIIGISGASGVIYGIRLLQVLRNTPVETHLVISRAAEIALAHETSRKIADIKAMADVHYAASDIGAAISSGSYRTDGMIVAPCSIRSMSEIATGVTSTLLTRAADVVLKERRRLVLMVRETPLHTGHLRTMLALSEMGAIIAPPVPAFYADSQSLDDMVDQTIGRVLDLFGIESGLVRRWREELMRRYLDTLLSQNRVRVVDREVSGRFELAAVTQRSQRESDAALLFRHVAGSRYPVMTNIFGSRPRLTELLGGNTSFCKRWTELMATPVVPPVDVAEPDGLQEIRLSDLPPITYFELDAGPYLTAGVYLANEPDTGVPNLSFHRAQIISDTELRVRLGGPHHLTRYQAKAEARGQALECAIMLGPPPELVLAAAAPIPYDESELEVAGRLAGRPLPMRRCRTIGLSVPAETEIVIEGRILPNLRRPEGPFGEFLGTYVPVGDNHVFEITVVIARCDAIYHALVCGSPEDLRLIELSVATQVYKALLAANQRGIIDVACVPSVLSTVVQIEQMYEGHARQVMLTAMGAGHDYNKSVLVVDDDVDINDFNDVWWAYLTRGRADQRALIIPDVPGFYRDPHKDFWGRLGIDATVPFGRKAEFLRKRIPGADTLNLADYLTR